MSSIVDSVCMAGKDNYLAVHGGSYMSERGKKAVCISASLVGSKLEPGLELI